MLVLARKKNELVFIETPHGLITIKVVELRPGKVRLGFVAPPEIKIVREELTK